MLPTEKGVLFLCQLCEMLRGRVLATSACMVYYFHLGGWFGVKLKKLKNVMGPYLFGLYRPSYGFMKARMNWCMVGVKPCGSWLVHFSELAVLWSCN
jgi:hypothetical protein